MLSWLIKGFLLIIFVKKNISIIRPPFLRNQTQFNKDDALLSKNIAKARVCRICIYICVGTMFSNISYKSYNMRTNCCNNIVYTFNNSTT